MTSARSYEFTIADWPLRASGTYSVHVAAFSTPPSGLGLLAQGAAPKSAPLTLRGGEGTGTPRESRDGEPPPLAAVRIATAALLDVDDPLGK